MTYTPIVLMILGLTGILLHNLVKLDSLNRLNGGTVNMRKYISMERFTIGINAILVIVAAIWLDSEYHYYLTSVGMEKVAGAGFIAFGYLGQSLLVKFIGRAQKKIDNDSTGKEGRSNTTGEI